MKRVISALSMACLLLIPLAVLAQSEVGSWKLNTEKSTYSGIEAPKRVTLALQATDGGVVNHTQGVAADGSIINFGYSAKYDGTEAPISGSGAWNGADSISLKRIDASTIDATYKKNGKVVNAGRVSISADSKTMTVTAQGTSPDGKPTEVHVVYERH
jgi:hypothetical protein